MNSLEREPVRTCVICRRKFVKKELARYVFLENGTLAGDTQKILPGRGWYCCADPQCVAMMQKYKPGLVWKKRDR